MLGRILLQAKKIAQCILRIFKAKRGLMKTYFLPLISVFTLVNSKLRNISNDKMTPNCLIINHFRYHLSFVICHFRIHPKFSAFGVIFITQAYFRQVENLRPPNIRLGICVYYENGCSPRPNLTHNRVTQNYYRF